VRRQRAEAARRLNINRQLLYAKMQRFGIAADGMSDKPTGGVGKADTWSPAGSRNPSFLQHFSGWHAVCWAHRPRAHDEADAASLHPSAQDGAIVIAQDNNRLRLLAGTTNRTTGNKTPPVSGDAIPKETYVGGVKTIEVGGRTAELQHVYNAHTDGGTWVYFPDANVICTGDVMNNNHRYQQVDFANGGDIRGMIRASNDWLKLSNDNTKVVVGHGPLAKKADVAAYNEMVKTARERVEKLVNEGKSEAEVVAAKPLTDLDKTWAANDQAAANFVKQVYHSFSRS
jgi:glyoxylase-like metal-dependent hydrolase (beta-lactamase superfamily II)